MSDTVPVKIFYLDPNEDVRDLYTMKLEAHFHLEVHEYEEEKALCDALSGDLSVLGELILLITDYAVKIEAPETSPFMGLYKQKLGHLPLAIMAEEETLASAPFVAWCGGLEKVVGIRRLVGGDEFSLGIKRILAAAQPTPPKGAPDGHTPVKIRNFLKFNLLPCDAYIRLGENKFVKLINQGDMYPEEIIRKYAIKNVSKLYVKSVEYPKLADAALRTLLALYQKKKRVEGSDAQIEALETIHEAMKSMGITEEVAELTKKAIESSVALAKQSRDIGQLLNKMKKGGEYLYEHSLMVSYISTAIARNTEWGSDATAFKLGLAAMMHDMTLEDNKMARIQTLNDPALKGYNEEQIERYKNHPTDAAKLIAEKKEFPPDVDFIVAQHHERPDGTGFPRGLSKLRISPLSCVFILAHEFVTRIEALGGDYTAVNREKVFGDLTNEMYTTGNFKKPFEGLSKAFSTLDGKKSPVNKKRLF